MKEQLVKFKVKAETYEVIDGSNGGVRVTHVVKPNKPAARTTVIT
jgi:hypothetical protein